MNATPKTQKIVRCSEKISQPKIPVKIKFEPVFKTIACKKKGYVWKKFKRE